MLCFFLSLLPFFCSEGSKHSSIQKSNMKVFSAGRHAAVRVKGNQVRVLSDPVTVNGETVCNAIVLPHEKAQPQVYDP